MVFGDRGTLVRGTDRPDVIVAGGGDDRIAGVGAGDRICGGPGDDRIRGGGGNDRVAGGAGNDKLVGGRGSDLLRSGGGDDRVFGLLGSDRVAGGAGGDHLVGGRGNDRLRGGTGEDAIGGGLGDDLLRGGAGSHDALVGGLGNDRLRGGRGAHDLLRGDFGRDLLDGGPGGLDIASFSSAADAMEVDLWDRRASGDGRDRLGRIEDIVGSAFDDIVRGNAGPNRIDGGPGDDLLVGGEPGSTPGDFAFGGSGSDRCAGFEREDSCEPPGGRPNRAGTSVELSRGLDGPSLTVRGTAHANRIRLLRRGAGLVVVDRRALDPAAVSGCFLTSPTTARCPGRRAIGFVLVDGGGGEDVIRVGESVPLAVPVRLSGGNGRDRVEGGRGDDVIDGGRGEDRLFGHGGSDALVAAFDADLLAGGGGADLLVAAGACTGDRLRGGDGIDNASFARVISGVVRARIGGRAVNLDRIRFHEPCRRVRIQASVENLEGSPGRDILIGDGGRNSLLGRGGADRLRGRGGRDRLVGGTGADALRGGSDPDLLFARDGRADRRVDCGAGDGRRQRARRDRFDPPAIGC